MASLQTSPLPSPLPSPASITNARRLILNIDGTNDSIEDATNVYKIFRALQMDANQVVGYQSGIGTYLDKDFLDRAPNAIDLTLDSGLAIFLEDHISRGYKWLADRYRLGDAIYLFGFSRGSHLVRCIAGMINKVGLVARKSQSDPDYPPPTLQPVEVTDAVRDVPMDVIKEAYKYYLDETVEGVKKAYAFKEQHSPSLAIPIKFVGCWDTVASVGIIRASHPPFAASNQLIKTFRHALALEEHRARFQENLWEWALPEPKDSTWTGWLTSKFTKGPTSQSQSAQDLLLRDYESRRETDVKEVWFPGCHADVGGGSVPATTPHALSKAPLRWMVREAAISGLVFHPDVLASYGLHTLNEPNTNFDSFTKPADVTAPTAGASTTAVDPSISAATSRSPTGGDAPATNLPDDVLDATSHIYDQLSMAVDTTDEAGKPWYRRVMPTVDKLKKPAGWWAMEYFLVGKNYADADGPWYQKIRWNRGQARIIQLVPESGKLKLHYTVGLRMKADPTYVPRATFFMPNNKKAMDLKLGSSDWSNIELVYDTLVK